MNKNNLEKKRTQGNSNGTEQFSVWIKLKITNKNKKIDKQTTTKISRKEDKTGSQKMLYE